MSEAPFRRRTVVVLAIACSLSLVTGLLLLVFGPELSSPPSASANGFSRSAVGPRALVELLQKTGVPVVVSRVKSVAMRAKASLLVVAEPDLDDPDHARELDELLRAGPPVLLVLPKRLVVADPRREGWVEYAGVGPSDAAEQVLRHVVAKGKVVDAAPSKGWEPGTFGVVPQIDSPRFLAPDPAVTPLVWAPGAGVLVGTADITDFEENEHRVAVLADADLVATHGLVRGDNALLVSRLVDRLRGGDAGPVIVDETLHGFEYEPGVWRELFRFPLVLSLIAVVLTGLLLVWAGIGRFGAPEPAPPPIAPGKAFLMSSTADLLRRGGHVGLALDRYLAATVQDVARATHAPHSLGKDELYEWLGRVGEVRGASQTIADLEGAVAAATETGAREPRQVVAAATAVHAWRKEMIDGPERDS